MFTNIRNVYGVIGAMLGLIGLFLLLDKSKGAARLFSTGGDTANKLARTLQGR